MLQIVLYTRPECTLCDEAKALLLRFRSRYPFTLREVDITRDEEAFARHRYRIPVFQIGEREVAAPISAADLENALIAASAG